MQVWKELLVPVHLHLHMDLYDSRCLVYRGWCGQIRVEAYVLNKITKDLPLHPIRLGLKWDHLSGIKLANSDFRSPVRIDLLLGAEILMGILHDGWQTGLWGTPSEINTCFGWVLFGKNSHVVDVANLNLEQEAWRELTGLRCSYAAVLTTNKEKDLCYLRQRNGRVVDEQPHNLRCESNHPYCRIQQQMFGRSRISQCMRNTELTAWKGWKSIWETQGFRLAECWSHIIIYWNLMFWWIVIVKCPVNIAKNLCIV